MVDLGDGLAWVWDKLVFATSFQHWPDGDPDGLRELGEQWTQLSNVIVGAYSEMGMDANTVVQNWGGDAGTAFLTRWTSFVSSDQGGPNAFLDAANDYALACQNSALQLEYAQLMCTIIVAITAIEIAIGIAFAEFGGLAFSAAAVAAGRAAIVGVLKTLSAQMAKQILKAAMRDAAKLVSGQAAKITVKRIALAGLRGGATFGGADVLAQQIQISAGHRDGFDASLIASSFVGGAAAGWSGALALRGMQGVGGRVTRLAGGKPLSAPLLSKISHPQALLAAQALAGFGKRGVTEGVINMASTPALIIAQNSLARGSLVQGFQDYVDEARRGGWAALGNQFVAGMFGGVVRQGIESPYRSLLQVGKEVTLRGASGDAALARSQALAAGRPSSLVEFSAAQAEATGLRHLEVAALERANDLPPGVLRERALDQAREYGHQADRADVQAATRLAQVEARVETARVETALVEAAHSKTALFDTAQRVSEPGPVAAAPVVAHRGAEPATSTVRVGEPARSTPDAVRTLPAGERVTTAAGSGALHAPTTETARLGAGSDPARPATGSDLARPGSGSDSVRSGDGPDRARPADPDPARSAPGADGVRDGGGPPARSGDDRTSPSRAEHPRIPEPVAQQLLDLRASHVAYVRAETTAGISEFALRDARQARAVEQAADLNRRHGLEPPADATHPDGPDRTGPADASRRNPTGADPESLTQHSMLWHDLATAERSSLVRTLNDLLRRPDLSPEMRPELNRMRDEYRVEGEARLARQEHAKQVEKLLDDAWGHARAGESVEASAAVRASADEVAKLEGRRETAQRALIEAEAAVRALPDPGPLPPQAPDHLAADPTRGAPWAPRDDIRTVPERGHLGDRGESVTPAIRRTSITDSLTGGAHSHPRPPEPVPEGTREPAHHQREAPDSDAASDQSTSDVAQTGADVRPRRPGDYAADDAWADRVYEAVRVTDSDVAAMARHLEGVVREDGTVGFTESEIRQIKDHVFNEEHKLNRYDDTGVVGHEYRRYDSSAEMAEAWIRLSEGRARPEDIVLLEHELAESRFEKANPGVPYAVAHQHANQRFDWAAQEKVRTGEDLEAWKERHGHTPGVPQGGRDGSGSALRVRLSGEGPVPDHQQGGRDVPGGGRPGGQRDGGSPAGDPSPSSSGQHLAERGRGPALGDGERGYRSEVSEGLGDRLRGEVHLRGSGSEPLPDHRQGGGDGPGGGRPGGPRDAGGDQRDRAPMGGEPGLAERGWGPELGDSDGPPDRRQTGGRSPEDDQPLNRPPDGDLAEPGRRDPGGDLSGQPAEPVVPRTSITNSLTGGHTEVAPRSTWDVQEFPRPLPDGHPLLPETISIQTPERLELRARIVGEALAGAMPPVDGRPVLYVMGGGGASGKGYVGDMLIELGEIPRSNLVHLDPDELKKQIPEFNQVRQAGDSRAAAVVHEESSMLAKEILATALDRGVNIFYDVTMGNPAKGLDLIQRAHDAGYDVHLHGVTIGADVAVTRNGVRAAETGRYVPIEMQLEAHQGFSRGFEAYADVADRVTLWDTGGTSGAHMIAEKRLGRTLEIHDPAQYRDFQHKADLDPHADGPGSLYPDRAEIRPPAQPRSGDEYVEQAMDNLRRTSRTAQGVVDTSASPDKAADLMPGLTGDHAAKFAEANFRRVISDLFDHRADTFSSPDEVRAFVENVARGVNHGILQDGVLYRQHDSDTYPSYTRVHDLPRAADDFYREFHERLSDPNGDPVETAAWVEYRMDLTDHLWADGTGKSSKAVAAWVLMRDGYDLPVYPTDRNAQFAAAPHLPRSAGPGVDHMQFERYHEYYRDLLTEGAEPTRSGDSLLSDVSSGSGQRIPMSIDTMVGVAEKYGIDLSEVTITINKLRTGYYGSTDSIGRITLTRDAFRNEEQLARTLEHERFHAEQLRSGMGYPDSYDSANAWESAALQHENAWWSRVSERRTR